MKKLIFLLFYFESIILFAQPSYFTWKKPNSGDNIGFDYISPAKDQGEQGPCGIFAAVGGIEALSQIYYHKPSSIPPFLDLSEEEMYSTCSGYGPSGAAPAGIENTLNYCFLKGLVNEACYPFPTQSSFYGQPCSKCSTPSQKVQITGYERISYSEKIKIDK